MKRVKQLITLFLAITLFSALGAVAANASSQFPILKHHKVRVLYSKALSTEWKAGIQQAVVNVDRAGGSDNDLTLTYYSYDPHYLSLALSYYCSSKVPCFVVDGHNYGVTKSRYYCDSMTSGKPYLRFCTINTSRWKATAGKLTHAAWKRKTANAVLLRMIGEPVRTGLSKSPLNANIFGQSYPASVDINWINARSRYGVGGGSW